jgi:hypothetical protein
MRNDFRSALPGSAIGATRTGRRPIAALALGSALLCLAACAGGAGVVRPLGEAPPVTELAGFHSVNVQVAAVDGQPVTSADLERIAGKIADHIRAMAPGRFATITTATDTGSVPAATPDAAAAGELDARVLITRYEPGSATARFFMAGLGQAHIDGRLDLAERVTGRSLGSHEVTKTFAWGGIYGATKDIHDVEEGFAEAVAEVLTGKPDT